MELLLSGKKSGHKLTSTELAAFAKTVERNAIIYCSYHEDTVVTPDFFDVEQILMTCLCPMEEWDLPYQWPLLRKEKDVSAVHTVSPHLRHMGKDQWLDGDNVEDCIYAVLNHFGGEFVDDILLVPTNLFQGMRPIDF